jgi:hypothetical protein
MQMGLCSNQIPTRVIPIPATAMAWVKNGDAIKGKFVEVTADRTSRQFASRGEISLVVKVNGNTLTGTASAIFYDAEGRRLKGPITATMEGQRVVP